MALGERAVSAVGGRVGIDEWLRNNELAPSPRYTWYSTRYRERAGVRGLGSE